MIDKLKSKTFLSQKCLEILIYSVIWIVIAIIPLFWNYNYDEIELKHLFNWLIRLAPFFIIFMINILWLIPRFLLRGNKRWLFFLLTFAISTTIITINPQARFKQIKIENYIRAQKHQHRIELEKQKPPRLERKDSDRPQFYNPPKPKIPWWTIVYINDLIVAITMIGLTIAIRLMFKSLKDQQIMSELKNQNTLTELEYLKHQINPHFLMNTLNNVHALIDIDSEQAKHSIIELSKIMRYVLYDTSGQTVWLSKELQFTNNYITLMSIRYDDSVDIKLNVQPNIPDIKIPPLLIQPFVENAFKHGISSIKQSFIHIDLSVDNNQLVCNVVNSNNHKNEDSGGIGLENIQKRLQLLFGDKYSLKIENTAETYTTTLTIPTSNDTMYSN